MNKTLKWLILLVVVLIVLAIVGKKLEWFGQGNVIKVSTEIVKRRTIVETVAANGKIQPEIEVKISPDVSGEIIELHVREGDEVQEGDLLVKINPDIYLSSVDRMDAALNTARANVANARARFIEAGSSFKRSKKLWDEGVISESDFETAEANFEVAEQNVIASEYNVKSAEASLKEARDQLSKTMIFAPVRGTVYMLNVEKGERVVGTSQMAGTELMRLANLNEMEVSVEVNENDIVRVSKDDTAEIHVDAYLDRKFRGIVTEVANSANTSGLGTDQVTNFAVKIRIIQDSYKDLLDSNNLNISPFRPGMSATVEIMTEKAVDVLSVPIQAVTVREDSISGNEKRKRYKRGKNDKEKNENESREAQKRKECVFLYDDNMAKLQFVKTGIQDINYIEVVEGIKEDQEIIVAPYSAVSKKLKEDSKVKKVEEELFEEKD